jgi:Tfp pilus assembly protein PilO
LVFGAAALVCMLFLAASVMVQLRQTYDLHSQRKAADEQLQELHTAIEGVDFEKLQEQNEALAAELDEIERSLPEAEYVPTLMRQIEHTLAITGNELIEIRQGEIRRGKVALITPASVDQGGGEEAAAEAEGATETAQGQRYDEMDFEVRFNGSYKGAFDYLKQLGSLGKIIAVETVEIERGAPGTLRVENRAPAQARLQARAYILAPQSGFPGELSIKIY